MQQSSNKQNWPMVLELLLFPFVLIAFCSLLIPDPILYSVPHWQILNGFLSFSNMLLFFAGIPVGIIGLLDAKHMDRHRVTTRVLSIVNLCMGIFEVTGVVLLFLAVLLGAASA